MTPPDGVLERGTEQLYDDAPCGLLSTTPDGTIVAVNGTFLAWTGYRREALVRSRRFQELLSRGGRIYYETHYAPLLAMQREVREIAVDIIRADGTIMPVLVNSVQRHDDAGTPLAIVTAVFTAGDRRRYEHELRMARERERAARERVERLEAAARDVATVLQASMLALDLPADPRFGLATRYRTGVETLDVGGDWYDAFLLDERRLGLVVGDVVGRGLEAATAMGQLRSAVRALALAGIHPGGVIDRLDRFVARLEPGQMATLAYCEVDLGTGVTRYACAGHPPPAVAGPARPASLLWGGRSEPLALRAPNAPRPQDETRLEPGSRLLLYSDGLVERRRHTIDDGLAALLAELDARRAATPAALVDALVDGLLGDADQPDDVCLLCADLRPAA